MRLAWANEEGCCVGEIEFTKKKKTLEMFKLQSHHEFSDSISFQINLLESVPVGLQADFHHLERIDDDRLGQARAEPGCRQRLEARGTSLSREKTQTQSRTDGESSLRRVRAVWETCSPSLHCFLTDGHLFLSRLS